MSEIVRIGDLKLSDDEKKKFYELIDSEMFSEGKYVREFEAKWASYVNTKHSTIFNSGTSAMMAGFAALQHSEKYNVKKSSKVITTPLTYIATVNSVVNTNLEPVFVDVRDDFNIDPEEIAKVLEESDDPSQFSIVLPVHLMGYVCDMDRINSIAKKHNLVVFEDAAEATGSLYKGRPVGSLSTLSDFSFYMAHAICAGEMGTLNTSDDELKGLADSIKANGRMDIRTVHERISQAGQFEVESDSGLDPRYAAGIIGYNFKATEFQALLGLGQITQAKEIIQKRQENLKYLNEGLEKHSDVLQLPKYSKDLSYLGYTLVLKDDNIQRKKIRDELDKRKIESRPLFGSIPHHQPSFAHVRKEYEGKLPKANFLGSRGFYVGVHQYLTQDQLDHVIKSFDEIIRDLK